MAMNYPQEQLITEPPMYEPTFNPETNTYYDENPYIKNQRNCIQMKCGCKTGAIFAGYTQFNNHSKSNAHCQHIRDFGKNSEEIELLKKEIATLSNALDICKTNYENIKKKCATQKSDIQMLENLRESFIGIMNR